MTNWMTAAGIAFIAGGLATLISFRAVLFGAGNRRRADRAARASRASRRRQPAALPVEPQEAALDPEPRPWRARGSRRLTAAAGSGQPSVAAPDDRHGGLASIGLAEEENPEVDEEDFTADVAQEVAPITVRRIDRSDRGYGDRVDGWVRPQYRDALDEPPAGEYWTPVPVELSAGDDELEPSATGYGWPVPVERLPPVPPYEPATGFDLIPVPVEPTEVVPPWPQVPDDQQSAIRLPQSWANRDEKPRGEEPKRRRPRPRPRPHPDIGVNRPHPDIGANRRHPDIGVNRPHPDNGANRSTVYVSRHAAEPPQ